MNSNERSHPLVNYSFTDDSDEESELTQSNGHTTDDEDIPSDDDISLVRWINKHFKVSDNISSIYEQNKYNKNNNLIIIIFNLF